MRPTTHLSNNCTFMPPEGMDNCESIQGTRAVLGDTQAIITFWKPSAEELASLNAGGSVSVCLLTGRLPPMRIDVEAA